VAKEFSEVTDSEEVIEPETETADVRVPEGPGGTPPKKVARATSPRGGGEGGGRFVSGFGGTRGAGFVSRTVQFLHDTRAEMRRVSWPSAAMVKNTTIITLIAVIFFAAYLFGVDRVWAFVIQQLTVFMEWLRNRL